jgi:cytochrome c556
MRRLVVAGLIALGVAAAGECGALAQDKSDVIKQRQALMKQQAEGLKAIQSYISGQIGRDAALAKANELMTLPPKILALFPEGTSLADFPGVTNAKPEIWEQWARFKDIPAALLRAETSLAADIKSGNKQDVLDDLDTVGRTGCGACHTSFRAPLKE